MIYLEMESDRGDVAWFYGKQVIGPDFANRIYVLICDHSEHKGFINSVSYYVMEYASLTPWGVGKSKAEAIACARNLIRKLKSEGKFIDRVKDGCKKSRVFRDARKKHIEELMAAIKTDHSTKPTKNKLREDVYKKSDGKCHYCEVELIDGVRWEVEHKIPKSRGGNSLINNLVAACAPCNREKRTMTDDEYFTYKEIVKRKRLEAELAKVAA